MNVQNVLLISSCMLFPIYKDPVGLYGDPVGLYKEHVVLYGDPVGLYKDDVGLYNNLQGFMMILWGCTPDTGHVCRE